MQDNDVAEARVHLAQALAILDRLGLGLAAIDVSRAIDRLTPLPANSTTFDKENYLEAP